MTEKTCMHGSVCAHVDDDFLTGERIECPGPPDTLTDTDRLMRRADEAFDWFRYNEWPDEAEMIYGLIALINRQAEQIERVLALCDHADAFTASLVPAEHLRAAVIMGNAEFRVAEVGPDA